MKYEYIYKYITILRNPIYTFRSVILSARGMNNIIVKVQKWKDMKMHTSSIVAARQPYIESYSLGQVWERVHS